MKEKTTHKVLIVDDSLAIHEDFRKTFSLLAHVSSSFDAEAAFILDAPTVPAPSEVESAEYVLDYASQGEEALGIVKKALENKDPFRLAFVDMRMPPGWDGVKTIEELWKADPRLQIVICTAYSDQSWEQIQKSLGMSDKLLILKKPFETIEILQHAVACCRKWELERDHELLVQKLAEEANWEKDRAEAIVSNAPDTIMTVNLDFNISYINRELKSMHGKKALGTKIFDLFGPSHAQTVENICRRVLSSGNQEHFDVSWLDGDHVSEAYTIRIGPITNDGVHRALVLVITDISERRNLEAQFMRAQHVEAVGRLAGGLAHDFNNLLTVQLNLTSMLLDDQILGPDVRKSVSMIRDTAERAANITAQLLTFSKNQPSDKRRIIVKNFLEQSQELMQKAAGVTVELNVTLPDPSLAIMGNAHQVEQALVNLIINARDAMPEGGKLSIYCKMSHVGATIIGSASVIQPGDYVVISLTDSGKGMTPQMLDKIFDPFFTTKEFGHGSGLGLSMVHGIMKVHEGHVHVYSESNIGTTFRLLFPAHMSDQSLQEELPALPPSELKSLFGQERVLLVEDDEQIREVLRTSLKSFGYDVRVATDGVDALKLISTLKDEITLVITDVVMPEMNGAELVHNLRQKTPNLKVIYMSGYTNDALKHFGLQDKDIAEEFFIQKPFMANDLLVKIRDIFKRKSN